MAAFTGHSWQHRRRTRDNAHGAYMGHSWHTRFDLTFRGSLRARCRVRSSTREGRGGVSPAR
eukprot:5808162-Alexandrium_andersonii.AAC.1